MRSVCWRSLAMSIWSRWQWLTISSAASCGIRPEPALHLGQRGFDVEVLLRCGSRRTRRGASRRVVKMPWKMAESMMVDGMAVLRSEEWVQWPARARVRCGLQHHRAVDHSAVEPGGARRGAARRPAPAAPRRGPRRPGPARCGSARPGAGGCTAWRRSRGARDHARSASSRASSSSWGVTPATGAASPATREATASRPAA